MGPRAAQKQEGCLQPLLPPGELPHPTGGRASGPSKDTVRVACPLSGRKGESEALRGFSSAGLLPLSQCGPPSSASSKRRLGAMGVAGVYGMTDR